MVSSYIAAIAAVIIAAVSQVLLKKEANNKHETFIGKFMNAKVILAYILLFGSLFLNTVALRNMELTVLPCITASSFIWILLFSYIYLGERPGKNKIIGSLIIAAGIIISRI